MYKQYRSGINTVTDSVEDAVQRSLSNLSAADLLPRNQLSGISEETESVAGLSDLSDTETSHSDVLNIVQECWNEIGSQCVEYGRKSQYGSREPDDGSWKTVRVFVSSTFSDFFCEREILVKKVFPELREWCRQRKLYFIECDLRWGVPSDTTTADTIAMCLEELDRCMKETAGEPFILNMLGEKYGWVPATDDIPESLKQKYQWVDNTSITFMELLHGAYRMQNSNALFMLRDEAVISHVPDHLLIKYKSTDPLDIEQLKQLKSWLQSRFPEQVFDYDCKVIGPLIVYGKDMVNIVELEGFCTQVLEFFKSAITRMYPKREAVVMNISSVHTEDGDQRVFIEEMSEYMIGRDDEIQLCMAYIQGQTDQLTNGQQTKPFARDASYWKELMAYENQLLCVHAPAGHGKTILMCKIAQLAMETAGDMRVFYHFCGATGQSNHVEVLLQRLMAFFTQDYTPEHLEILYQTSNNGLKDMIREQLIVMETKPDEKILLIIDGLDQLLTSNSVHHLSWLAPRFPENILCIVSCQDHPPTVSRIQEYSHHSLQLGGLTRQDAKKIVQSFLARYNKKLETSQLQMILDSKCSQTPLWLYYICEELRIYGDFRTLTTQVKTVTTSVEAILESMLERVIAEDDTGGCMEKTLCVLACSYGVITALDLQRLLGNIEKREPLAALHWVRVRLNLKTFLRVAYFNEQLTFVHDQIKQVIWRKLLSTRVKQVEYHTLIADYMENWCEDSVLRRDCLPNHLEAANLKKRLVNYLRNAPEASNLPSFKRSSYISKSRCRNLADPVIKGVKPVVICNFCKMKQSVYHPQRYHGNENMCIVCGNRIQGHSPMPNKAHVCQFHAKMPPNVPPLCFLCNHHAMPAQAVPGRLCMYCSFGNNAKTCAFLDLQRFG